MAGVGLSFDDTDDGGASGGRTWLVIAVLVTLATVGAILLVRAFGGAEGEAAPENGAAKPEAAAREEPASAAAERKKEADAPKRPALPPADASKASERALALLRAGEEAEKADDFYAARTNYLAALADPGCGSARPVAEARLGAVDIELIFSPRKMDGKIDYAIAPGDSLKKIANRHGTTVDLIMKGNAVPNPDRVQVGDRLRVLDNQVFEIAVSKSRNDLVVTLNGQFFKRYTVGTGKFAKTPVGTFQVTDKIPEPPWWRPDGKVVPFGDKENILGTRWMAIAATGDTPPAKGYGIHGTWDESSLGQQSSAGCIRMANRDVEELFIYIPLGTKVVIGE